MSRPFQSKLFSFLNQDYKTTSIWKKVFDGAKPEIMGESPYLNARKSGLSFALDKKNRILAIFLYREGYENYSQFPDEIPGGFSFNTTRQEIRDKLGEPAMTAEPGGEGIMAIEFAFDRYESADYYLRFQYCRNATGLQLITLGSV
jgi:hypothetical protein